MHREIDIIENNILNQYPEVLNILLCDRTTRKNIIWATDNYQQLGIDYNFEMPIKLELITGINTNVIMPRVLKKKSLQKTRIKDMAEVYTPAWICNEQNNLIDNSWFNKKEVFNKRYIKKDGSVAWKNNHKKIEFLNNRTWNDYVNEIRLEISCGEAPYLASRYDTTNGKYILVKNRIGLLDRKLRIINENVDNKEDWLKASEIAYKSIYAYEYHGDSLLLARESLLYTYIENYFEKFNTSPELSNIQNIANIISWNIWQMDGLK